MPEALVGIIGGSGLYELDGLTEIDRHIVETPFGRPSDAIITGRLAGTRVAFLARHGQGHRLVPSEVPYRANIYAMKTLGVRYLISVSAVGSLREDIRPLDIVLPDQFIDLTRHRESSFFGGGVVAHVSMAQPICAALTEILCLAFAEVAPTHAKLRRGGTYICIEGPAFSTQAEAHWYRNMGASVVGMTNMPEVKLAREAQIAYATMALVTDYDCWHPREAHVTADLALQNLRENVERSKQILTAAIGHLARFAPDSTAHQALQTSLITLRSAMSPEVASWVDMLLEGSAPKIWPLKARSLKEPA